MHVVRKVDDPHPTFTEHALDAVLAVYEGARRKVSGAKWFCARGRGALGGQRDAALDAVPRIVGVFE
jgi:hypothetical protein